MPLSRRTFLQQSLTAMVGSSVLLRNGVATGCARGGGSAADEEKLDAIGLQLYTVRSEMQRSVEATLARVAQIGYKEVEFAGYFGRTPQQIRDALKANGLTSPASHVDMRAPWDKTLADAAVVGHEYLVVPWIDESMRTADGIKRIAEEFNTRADAASKAGLKFAYHNHDFEFKTLPGGALLYDTLLETTDTKLVLMEMDLYWINHGGADPVTYWKKYPGRFPLLHVKDMMADREMTEVGSGTLPWGSYFHQRALSGARHFFVEHDHPADAFASITKSYTYLRNLEF